jgi:hypothetical protein
VLRVPIVRAFPAVLLAPLVIRLAGDRRHSLVRENAHRRRRWK